jgi:hypothetical protein
LIAS